MGGAEEGDEGPSNLTAWGAFLPPQEARQVGQLFCEFMFLIGSNYKGPTEAPEAGSSRVPRQHPVPLVIPSKGVWVKVLDP